MGGGTEAFPDLGRHCQLSDCHQLDFLPFTCHACHKVSHFYPFILRFCFTHHKKFAAPFYKKDMLNVIICYNMAIHTFVQRGYSTVKFKS